MSLQMVAHKRAHAAYAARRRVEFIEVSERLGEFTFGPASLKGIFGTRANTRGTLEGEPIYAFTNHSQTRRRLALNRSVFAHRTAFSNDPEKTLQRAFTALRQREGLPDDAKLVIISDVLADQPADAIQVRKLGAD